MTIPRPAPEPAGSTPAPLRDDPPPWLRVVGVFDLETTGIDVRSDRVVTAHVGLLDATGAAVCGRSWRADPGVEIPAAATAVHGISTAQARATGRPAAEVVAEVVGCLRGILDAGIPVVAYNAAYDFTLLRHEALRHDVVPLEHPHPVFDPLVIDRHYDRYRRGKRTLTRVAEHYAVRLDEAHEAAADARAAGRVAQALARRYRGLLPSTARGIHVEQIAWARDQAASLTEYFVRIGRIDPGEPVEGTWPVR
ncbi:exonuclease domain-containing protein [Microbacterium sp. ET2]|uniref:exonuclease domain-containing protein n=1 Tax=Microbacterium albipurpureum TaxID=3050384 RepID=UPI00259C9281|nr:exonuclease domain-containing protein [Microbacterium sp. ET2 (Ac-2212)]WJL95480.1 exonuclease domain-containing protein [Microbacterium sp. ET2 (Ac-2212)]